MDTMRPNALQFSQKMGGTLVMTPVFQEEQKPMISPGSITVPAYKQGQSWIVSEQFMSAVRGWIDDPIRYHESEDALAWKAYRR